ncbi:MAG: flavodoxin [Oligoflexia bacterium]|nr:flavodoxin [Oligoflexia bacterium]
MNIKRIIVVTVLILFSFSSLAQQASLSNKVLIAYFSHSGNTRVIANMINKNLPSDIFEIQTVKRYPQDYEAVKKIASQEKSSNARPTLKTKVDDFKKYDVIFIGYPNWWGTIPMPIASFLMSHDFSGKTIVPFCTHDGSRLGNSVDDIKALAPKAKFLDGLAVRGGSVNQAQDDVSSWLLKLKLLSKK